MSDRFFPGVEEAYGELSLTKNLKRNRDTFKGIFANDDTIRYREFGDRKRFLLMFVDSMVSDLLVNETVVEPIERALRRGEVPRDMQELSSRIIEANDLKITGKFAEILDSMLYGDTLLIMDGSDEALIISSKGWKNRGVSASENEKALLGPQEAFAEAFMINLSLIRRKLRTPDLKFSLKKIGRVSRTDVAVCYMAKLVDPEILQELERRLEQVDINVLLDSNYISEIIADSPRSVFRTIGTTERPDVAAAKLCEGRIVVVVDGSPTVLTLPHLMMEYFQNQNDYYSNFYIAGFSRFMRYVGFAVTVSIPALYTAFVAFHPEALPAPLLISILQARQGVPMPTALEVFVMLIALELLQEAGLLAPSSIGQPLSIVGGLVLGQAAVDARFVSAPVLIVVAVWAVTNMMLPNMRPAVVFMTFFLLALSSTLGIYGYIFGVVGMVVHLSGINSFGIPYTAFFVPYTRRELRDSIVRAPWNRMRTAPLFGKKSDGGDRQ